IMRVCLALSKEPAGLQQLVPGLVNGGRRVVERAHDRELLGPRCRSWEVLAQIHSRYTGANCAEWAANVLRRIGLRVKGIKLAGAADQQQQNAIEVALGTGMSPPQVAEEQPRGPRSERPGPKKIASRKVGGPRTAHVGSLSAVVRLAPMVLARNSAANE